MKLRLRRLRQTPSLSSMFTSGSGQVTVQEMQAGSGSCKRPPEASTGGLVSAAPLLHDPVLRDRLWSGSRSYCVLSYGVRCPY